MKEHSFTVSVGREKKDESVTSHTVEHKNKLDIKWVYNKVRKNLFVRGSPARLFAYYKSLWMHDVHEICIKERAHYVWFLFRSDHQQRFFLEPMHCSVLPRPAVTIHVTCTRRRDRSVPAVIIYDVRVADGASVVESRRALGSQMLDGGRCNASLRNVDGRPRCEVASHGGCAALRDSFSRHGSAGSTVD